MDSNSISIRRVRVCVRESERGLLTECARSRVSNYFEKPNERPRSKRSDDKFRRVELGIYKYEVYDRPFCFGIFLGIFFVGALRDG